MSRPLVSRLTSAAVEKRGVGTLTDPAVAGLMLRVRKTSTRGVVREFRFRYKFRGRTGVITLGHFPGLSLADARARAQRFRDLLQEGINPRSAMNRPGARTAAVDLPAAAGSSHNVAALIKDFTERHLRKRRKRPEYAERILQKELAEWSHRDARTIKPREVIELLDAIVERPAPVMANRVAGLLSQMFRYGIHRQIVETSPVQLLFRPGGTERPRQRALDDKELGALLASVNEVTKRAKRTGIAIRLILLTAVRRSELTGARWSELDLEAKAPIWDIPPERTKTGVGFAVPLTPPAVEQFGRLKRLAGRSSWIFPAETGDGPVDPRLLTRSIARHLETFAEHKIGSFTLHDLRRTVRTGLAKLGIRPDIAERCLNHAQPGIMATYDTHHYLEEKRDALTQWADHLQVLRDGT
jgi:integrase